LHEILADNSTNKLDPSANPEKQQRVHLILDKIVMKPVLDNTDEVNDGCGLRICCFSGFDAGSELSSVRLSRAKRSAGSVDRLGVPR
tara:strand:- start:61 stop:321 length:261 start_codon:yes stop_codon:yes gene_type:complete